MSTFYSNKTVLVTGATGLIGSNLVDRLMSFDGVNVVALSRSEEKLKEAFKCYEAHPRFSYVAQDIDSPIALDKRVDIIFHAAGPMEGKVIANQPLNVIYPNIIGTKNCFDYMLTQKKNLGHNCRLVLFSSVTVYGNNSGRDRVVSEADTDITDILAAERAPYSQSKRMSEVMATAYKKQYGADVVIARFSTVYGNTRFKPDTAFFEFVKKALSGTDIVINNSKAPRRDNIYIDDAVDGVLAVAEKGNSAEAYNISSNAELGNFAAVDEIAAFIVQAANERNKSGVKVIGTSAADSRSPGLLLNNSKLKSLGWNLKTSITEGIRHVIQQISKEQ